MSSAEKFSRRRAFGTGAAALALAPGLARAATGTLLSPPGSPVLPKAVERIQGAADAQNRLTVETYIDDKGPYSFVVDTGADRSVLSEDVADALGLPAAEDVIVQGIARALPARAVAIGRLQMGRVRITDLTLPLLPRPWLGADGYLGLDVIDRQSVTFDFANHRLEIEPSDFASKWLPFSDQALVRVNGSNGRLTAVNCTVNGVKAFAFIDSGAEISIGNTHLFNELAKGGLNYLNDDVVQLLGVTGGSATGRIAAIDRIKVGSISFHNSAIVISDLPVFDIWGLDGKPALFIGMNFLRQTSSVTIDYGRKEYRFKLASQVRIASRA